MSEKVQRLIFSHSFFFSHETPNKQKKSRFRSGTLSKIMPTGSMLKKLSMVTIVLSTMVDTELMWPKFLVYVSDTLNDTLNQHHIIYVRKNTPIIFSHRFFCLHKTVIIPRNPDLSCFQTYTTCKLKTWRPYKEKGN